MPLTKTQVKELEKIQSNYGCGANDCLSCYPIQYRCEWCGEDFPEPIRNGESFICDACNWWNNEPNIFLEKEKTK